MSQNIVIVLLLSLLLATVRCQTLMDIIQTESDLGEFREYAQKFLAAQLSEPSYTYTVFAPTDDAFLYYIRENAGNTNQLDSLPLWSYHLLNKKYTREDLLNNGNHSLPTLAPNSAPVWVIITDAIQSVQRDRPTVPPVPGQEPEPGKVISVNEGNLLPESKVASNGVLHKIDRIIFPSGVGDTIFDFIVEAEQLYPQYQLSFFSRQAEAMPESLKLLLDLPGTQKVHAARYTMFVPNDEAFSSMPEEARDALLNDTSLYEKVLRAHVINDNVVFNNNFRKGVVYNAYSEEGAIQLHFDHRGNETDEAPDEFYVASTMTSSVDGLLTGDVYARVVKANIACENGVVHIIDNVLAYIYKSIDVTLMTSKNMSLVWHDVLSKAVMAPLRERLMQDDVTVFVPSNSAFEKLPIQKQTELLADEENLYKLMELHILDGRVDLMGQDNQSTLDTMNPDKKLRLNIIINDTAQTYYVNGDGVWAEVVQSNVGATNGVVHLIDTILGFPYQTVWEHITENPELTGIRRNVEKASNTMKEYMSIENEKLTFFAPNNDAFLDMYRQRYDDYEALTQGEPDVLENVLETHLLRGQVVTLDDLVDNMQLSTINGKTLVLKHDEFDSDRWHISDGTVEAEIIRGQKMTNGFIYIIDRVLYTSGDIKHAKGGDSAEVSGSLAPCWRISGLLLQIITTVHVLRVAIFNC